jgi:hypothetical protein
MTEKNFVIMATLGTIALPMLHLFCRFPTALVPFLIFEREATFPYLFEPQCTQLVVAQSLGPAVLHLSRLNQKLVYNISILIVQWDMLAMSVHQISLQYLCLARPGQRPRSLNRHRRGHGCCIQQLRLNEFTKTKRWRNCKNGLAKMKIIVNWSVRKRKTFENNYSQGRSRMGMPLRYMDSYI